MHYELQPPCYPFIYPYISPSLTRPYLLPLSLLPLSTYLPTYIYQFSNLPIPIYLCIFVADPGAGIGLVAFEFCDF